ncbi:helix-turn-helix domain-containing protein [Candidatus Kirkpatrickella diaphorinae]|uniref:Helix-turn-helix domain-containing protein n=1 Tax=Candidatus Kirkpatrickella diaphorinae TaxID=2984322 RepID=A0ABY6GJI1_9PROT|nr:helix-turn-helix transcriptional regulator [Candidatus Kirkpatrickella diaphorinae]UYH50836.1 helix-turn-helix domain-containing protein [Candidatus Kirkpatrickella diaphorinae]
MPPSLTDLKRPRSADMIAFGRRLKKLRIKLGMTQSQLALHLGVSENAIVQYETGRSFPRRPRLLILAKVLEVDLTFLLSGATTGEGQARSDFELAALRLFRLIPHAAQPDMLEAMRLYARAFKSETK